MFQVNNKDNRTALLLSFSHFISVFRRYTYFYKHLGLKFAYSFEVFTAQGCLIVT